MQDDPIAFPHRYTNPLDIEVAGWISAALALGRVDLFKKVTEKILHLMAGQPHDYLMTFNETEERKRFHGISYRFYTSEDIFRLVALISQVVKRYGSVGALLRPLYREEDVDLGPTLSRFVETLRTIDPRTRTAHPFFSSPISGSACKRLNLYFRWMVRHEDGVDFGIWRHLPASKLIIPLDTHVARIAQYLGLTRRKTPDWNMAVEITDYLKKIDPDDPLKFDFSLCHLGISGACPITPDREKCLVCPLLAACRRGCRLTE